MTVAEPHTEWVSFPMRPSRYWIQTQPTWYTRYQRCSESTQTTSVSIDNASVSKRCDTSYGKLYQVINVIIIFRYISLQRKCMEFSKVTVLLLRSNYACWSLAFCADFFWYKNRAKPKPSRVHWCTQLWVHSPNNL